MTKPIEKMTPEEIEQRIEEAYGVSRREMDLLIATTGDAVLAMCGDRVTLAATVLLNTAASMAGLAEAYQPGLLDKNMPSIIALFKERALNTAAGIVAATRSSDDKVH